MSVHEEMDNVARQSTGPLAVSESAALGLQPDADDRAEIDEGSGPLPLPLDEPSEPTRTEFEVQIEKTERRDAVEPGLSRFRKKRELHFRQYEDLHKKAGMVSNRIDKLNDDVDKLRQQWSELEREKAALLVSSERYKEKIRAQEKVVRKDDKVAKKYHDYLMLNSEVLALEDSDDEDDQLEVDWGMQVDGGAQGDDGQ